MNTKKPRDLKILNRKRVLDAIRDIDSITVAEITKATELSRTIVMRSIRHFQNEGLICSIGKGESTDEGGKRPELFQFNSKHRYIVITHISPKEIYTGVTDLSSGILKTKSTKMKVNSDFDTVTDIISNDILGILKDSKIPKVKLAGIAIGAHGISDIKNGTVTFSPHFPSWGINLNLAKTIKDKISIDVPVFVDNQIRFQAFAEQQKGVARNFSNVVVIEGGIGLVAGIIIDNKIQRGVNNFSGEIGHMILDAQDPEKCHCGNHGCFERKIDINNILKTAKQEAANHPNSTIHESAINQTLSFEEVFKASNSKDPLACHLIDITTDWFAIGLKNMTLMLNPDVIVIHGIYSNPGDYFKQQLKEKLSSGFFSNTGTSIKIKYSKWGKDRCIIGGADFVAEHYFNNLDLSK